MPHQVYVGRPTRSGRGRVGGRGTTTTTTTSSSSSIDGRMDPLAAELASAAAEAAAVVAAAGVAAGGRSTRSATAAAASAASASTNTAPIGTKKEPTLSDYDTDHCDTTEFTFSLRDDRRSGRRARRAREGVGSSRSCGARSGSVGGSRTSSRTSSRRTTRSTSTGRTRSTTTRSAPATRSGRKKAPPPVADGDDSSEYQPSDFVPDAGSDDGDGSDEEWQDENDDGDDAVWCGGGGGGSTTYGNTKGTNTATSTNGKRKRHGDRKKYGEKAMAKKEKGKRVYKSPNAVYADGKKRPYGKAGRSREGGRKKQVGTGKYRRISAPSTPGSKKKKQPLLGIFDIPRDSRRSASRKKARTDPFNFPVPETPKLPTISSPFVFYRSDRIKSNKSKSSKNEVMMSSNKSGDKKTNNKSRRKTRSNRSTKSKVVATITGTVCGNCTRISITKPVVDDMPGIDSFPPPRAPRLVPRLYAQNSKGPLAAETRKRVADAEKAAALGLGPGPDALPAAPSASRGHEITKIAPFMLHSPGGGGKNAAGVGARGLAPLPPQRVQNKLHKFIVSGDFESAWKRIWTHSGELHVMDNDAMIPLDYAITFDVPSELLEAILQAQSPLQSNAYSIQHPRIMWDGKMTTRRVSTPCTDADTLQQYIYNDAGQLPIHRAFVNNCALRVQRTLLQYNPELCISETLSSGLIETLTAEQETSKQSNLTLMCWSNDSAKAFVSSSDPNFWLVDGASGPRCSRAHVRRDSMVVSNLYDCAWNSTLERAVVGREVFVDEKLDTIDKCTNPDHLEEPKRIAITLMWKRFHILLQATYDTFFSERVASEEKKKAETAMTAAAATSTPESSKMRKTAGKPPLPPPPPPHGTTGTVVPPAPPIPFTYNPTAPDETLDAPTFPALAAALLSHNVSLDVIQFILRIFPNQVKMKDPASGLYPLHVVATGMCPPLRWGWNVPADDNTDLTRMAGETIAERDARREQERSIALIPLLMKAWPEGAKMKDVSGRLAVHHALERGHRYHERVEEVSDANRRENYDRDVIKGCYNTGLKELLDACPEAHTTPDPKTGLYPFMLAASSPRNEVADLNTVYELLMASPDTVRNGIVK